MMMMRHQFATTSLRLLLLALTVSGTSAVYCNFSHENYWGDNAVSNQEELETYYAGCTEIYGNVNIAANYTGRFYFPNVTSIRGTINTPSIYNRDKGGYDLIPTPLLTSIEVPNLNDTYSIDINGVPKLTTISFPSLTVVNGTLFITGIEACSVDFPSLTTTEGGLKVTGNSTSLNFPLLANVGYMRVSRNPTKKYDEDTWRDYLLVDRVDQLPLDISFPALQKASSVYLQGNISSLSMPRLSRIGDEDQYFNRYVKIRTHGNPLNISLPSLSDLRDISVAGTIRSISFPSLLSIERFEVNTSTPLNVTLEPIQTISEYFQLLGNVTAVSMSSITKLKTVNIDSNFNGFYCSSIASDFERIAGRPLKDYECSGPPKSKLPLILGLGIGFGVPALVVVVYCLRLLFKRMRGSEVKTPKREDTLPEYELGVPPTYDTNGPPTYDAAEEGRSEQGAGGVAGARSGDANSARGEGASEHSVGDAASARPRDGNSARQDGA